MTSSIPPCDTEHGTSMHRLITPTARILAAAVILFTGAGVSAIFWKMPASAEHYELYHADVVDKNLAAVPLPSESVASISPEESAQMALPTLETEPVADTGAGKYAQVYETPEALASLHREQTSLKVVEPVFAPVSPQKFEPMRQVTEEKPIAVESVDRAFQSKPVSINTTEKSDELLVRFHFAENNRADFEASASDQPTDPFPMNTVPESSLQPLRPLRFESLSPLLQLQDDELLPLSALTAK